MNENRSISFSLSHSHEPFDVRISHCKRTDIDVLSRIFFSHLILSPKLSLYGIVCTTIHDRCGGSVFALCSLFTMNSIQNKNRIAASVYSSYESSIFLGFFFFFFFSVSFILHFTQNRNCDAFALPIHTVCSI